MADLPTLPDKSNNRQGALKKAPNRVARANISNATITGYRFIDTFLCAMISSIPVGLSVFYCAYMLAAPGASDIPVTVLDTALALAGTAIGIYWLSCIFPVWLGTFLLLVQLAAGINLGQLTLSLLAVTFGRDPHSLGFLYPIFYTTFFFLFAIWPVICWPMYMAVLESSRLRNTLGFMGTDIIVGDLRGRQLNFPHALRKGLVESFQQALYMLLFAIGKTSADQRTWHDVVTSSMLIKKPEKVAEEIRKSKNRVSVRYRAFQALEGVVLRADNLYVPKVLSKEDLPFRRALKFVGFMGIITACTCVPILLRVQFDIMRILMLHGAASMNVVHTAALRLDPQIVSGFGALFRFLFSVGLFTTGIYLLLCACRPTHIELTRKGLRFLCGAMPGYMQDKSRPWKDIRSVAIEKPTKSTSVADHWLVFNLINGGKMRMRLGSITSVTGKEEILKAIERWAPKMPRDVEVIRSLQPPLDYSYTELWLEALSAPPKRDKLKPLIEGASLKEHQYAVKSVLGSGGQGSAYLAEDCLADKTVVLKEFVLPVYVDVAVRRKALEVFEKEGRLLKQLKHPQVVTLIDYFVEDHRAYLVLEHIDGDSLRALVAKNGALAEDKVRELAGQMCDILEYLHSQSPPVVHRDFTPDNLILRKDGTLKLIDFNVAQQTDSTTTGTVVGKPAYLPAEQFRGQPTAQSDLYALGASLYFLLAGEDPVPIASADICAVRPEISFELGEIIKKATQPEPEDRFLTAREITEHLSPVLSSTMETG